MVNILCPYPKSQCRQIWSSDYKSFLRRIWHIILDTPLLGVFSLSRTWIYKQVWWNEKFWVMYVTILCWTLWCRLLPNTWWNLREYSISQLVPVFIGTDHSFFMQVSCESSFEYQTKTLISYSFFACVPNLMSQIPSVMISLGARTIVALLPVGSCGIQFGLSKRPR